jgi:hypothetical protein
MRFDKTVRNHNGIQNKLTFSCEFSETDIILCSKCDTKKISLFELSNQASTRQNINLDLECKRKYIIKHIGYIYIAGRM